MKPFLLSSGPSFLVLSALIFTFPAASAENIAKVYTALRGQHACALSDQGHVKCWGDNSRGQLGQERSDYMIPASQITKSIELAGPVQQLALAKRTTCALLVDGTVQCWGYGDEGQLANGRQRSLGRRNGEMGMNLPRALLGKEEGKAIQISAGEYFFCALFESGRVKCWGRNDVGQLGLGDTENRGLLQGYEALEVEKLERRHFDRALPAVDLGEGTRVLQITCGERHTCALTDKNEVKCWGLNGYDEQDNILGPGAQVARGYGPGQMGANIPSIPLGLQSGERIARIEAGADHTCAVLSKKKDNSTRLKCWGVNRYGQLGVGDTRSRGAVAKELVSTPGIELGMPSDDPIVDLSLGNQTTCVLFKKGSVKCWGLNDEGRLGLGDTTNRGVGPGQMGTALHTVSIAPSLKIESISYRYEFGCAVVGMVHAIKCWGLNYNGALGLDDSVSRGASPEQMGNQLPYANVNFL